MKTLFWLSIIFLIIACLSSCLSDNPNDLAQVQKNCDTTYCYLNIKPIVAAKCAVSGCHIKGGSGLGDFTVFANFKSVADNGNLKYRINLPVGNVDHMPKIGFLSEIDKSTINGWIDSGANGCW
jgi:hypothetical protein